MVASFDDYAAVPEVCLDVYDGLLTFEDSLAGIAEGVGIHRQQTAEVAVFHSHPKELTAHHAIDEMKIAVLGGRHRYVIVFPISKHGSERVLMSDDVDYYRQCLVLEFNLREYTGAFPGIKNVIMDAGAGPLIQFRNTGLG